MFRRSIPLPSRAARKGRRADHVRGDTRAALEASGVGCGLESTCDFPIEPAGYLGSRRADKARLLGMAVVQEILAHEGQLQIGRGAVGQTNIRRDVSYDRLEPRGFD